MSSLAPIGADEAAHNYTTTPYVAQYFPEGHIKWRLKGKANFDEWKNNIVTIGRLQGVYEQWCGREKVSPKPTLPDYPVLEQPAPYQHAEIVPYKQMQKAELQEILDKREISWGPEDELEDLIRAVQSDDEFNERDEPGQPSTLLQRLEANHRMEENKRIQSRNLELLQNFNLRLKLYKCELSAWKDSDATARLGASILRESMDDYPWRSVEHLALDPERLWSAIFKLHQPPIIQRLNTAWGRITKLKYRDYQNALEYIVDFNKVWQDLQDAGGSLGYGLAMLYLKRGLPYRFEVFTTHTILNKEKFPDTKTGYQLFCDTLVDFEDNHAVEWAARAERKKNQAANNTSGGHKGRSGSCNSFSSGSFSTHSTSEEQPDGPVIATTNRPPDCHYCGITGHIRRNCRKKKRDENAGIFRISALPTFVEIEAIRLDESVAGAGALEHQRLEPLRIVA